MSRWCVTSPRRRVPSGRRKWRCCFVTPCRRNRRFSMRDAAPARFGASTGTDLFVGRNTYGTLARLGVADIALDYVVVDTLRVPRETFAAILEAWRDGYADVIGETTPITREAALAYFEQM